MFQLVRVGRGSGVNTVMNMWEVTHPISSETSADRVWQCASCETSAIYILSASSDEVTMISYKPQ
jgi:hypothetical protein